MIRRCANPQCRNLFTVCEHPPINIQRHIYCSAECRAYMYNRNEKRKEWMRKRYERRKKSDMISNLHDL